MKVLVVSDLHLEFSVPDLGPAARKADAIILAGDIHLGSQAMDWIVQQFGKRPVLYVPGNHEFYRGEHASVLRNLRAAAAKHGNIHILDQDSVVLGEVEFLGATLWTDFALYGDAPEQRRTAQDAASARMPDFTGVIRFREGDLQRSLTPDDARRLHAQARDWIAAGLAQPSTKKRVVITHHLPAEASVAPRYKGDSLSPAFASRLEDLVRQADVWIHGHTHDCMDYRLGDCRVVCNPRGYVVQGRAPENPDFNPELIIDL